jgi:alpha-amylase/alpha-mannosidase (GH57 family)
MNKRTYLTIHGHFYQPPRENPWIENVEMQESAMPFHDWNERVCRECYLPNTYSKIVGDNNKLIKFVNNYSLMSFNIGPTLLAWMEKNNKYIYNRIIDADKQSIKKFNGHGSAIAQIYNHIIMPLANTNDKITEVIWGIRDFQKRFGRLPEGMWLAETACDDETLAILSDFGIKFTILSPFQADKIVKDNDDYIDVSDGSIDTTQAYSYKIKCRKNQSIAIFFYNSKISQAVAFEELLRDGGKFAEKLKTGIKENIDRPQIINIATDGESYGHHTKFGEMALSYVLDVKAPKEGFILTNYSEFLSNNPPKEEVIIKPVSSWSCWHGVERWKSNCGCSTGGMQGWNQKWRTPLRNSLDFLRDKLYTLSEKISSEIFKDFIQARNNYINVILNRSENSLNEFFNENLIEINEKNKINALKIMEIQRNLLLMYTSCGWFFNELSGIETVQILKYAARAIQLAEKYTEENIEEQFLEILKNAKSNISEYGNGKDIWNRFVKPSIMNYKNIVTLWAVNSLYSNYPDEIQLYSYNIKKINTKIVTKGTLKLLIGRVIITSNITLEKKDTMFALIQLKDGDFRCSVKTYDDEYIPVMKNLINTFLHFPHTEIIRFLDEYFGKEYFTLQNILLEDRKKILKNTMLEEMTKLQNVYNDIYKESKDIILYYKDLGLTIPEEYKIAAKYTLSNKFNKILETQKVFDNENLFTDLLKIKEEADILSVKLNIDESEKKCSLYLEEAVKEYLEDIQNNSVDKIATMFKIFEKLNLNIDLSNSQYIFFNKIFVNFTENLGRITNNSKTNEQKEKIMNMLKIGEKLNIDTTFYRNQILQEFNKIKI